MVALFFSKKKVQFFFFQKRGIVFMCFINTFSYLHDLKQTTWEIVTLPTLFSFIHLTGRLLQFKTCMWMVFNLSPVEKVSTCFISGVEHWQNYGLVRSSILWSICLVDRMVLDVHLSPCNIFYIWMQCKCYIKRIITKRKSVKTMKLKTMKLDAVDIVPSLIWLHHNLF